MRNDFNCFLASSQGHHQLDSCLRCGIFIRTDDGVQQPTHGDTNLYYLLLFQSWQKQLPIRSQQKRLGRRRQRFEVSQNKKRNVVSELRQVRRMWCRRCIIQTSRIA